MSSKFGMPPGPPQRQKVNIDMSQAKDVACDHCGNYTFTEVFLMKFLSKIVHPEGKEGYLPVPTFACNSCGFVNDNFLPPYMRGPAKEPVEGSKAETDPADTVAVPPPSKIEIVR